MARRRCSSIRLMSSALARADPAFGDQPDHRHLRGVDRTRDRSCRAARRPRARGCSGSSLMTIPFGGSSPRARASALSRKNQLRSMPSASHDVAPAEPLPDQRREAVDAAGRVPAPGRGAVRRLQLGQDRKQRHALPRLLEMDLEAGVAAGGSRLRAAAAPSPGRPRGRAAPCRSARPACRHGRPSGRRAGVCFRCSRKQSQRVAAPGIAIAAARRGGERRQRVEDHELRIVPPRHQAHDPVLRAEIEPRPAGAIVGHDPEVGRQAVGQRARTKRGGRLFRRRPSRRRHRARGAAGGCASRGSCRPGCRPRRPPRRCRGPGSSCRCRAVRRPAPPCRMRATAPGDRCAAAGRPPSAGRR